MMIFSFSLLLLHLQGCNVFALEPLGSLQLKRANISELVVNIAW